MFAPVATGLGAAVSVTERSGDATVTFAAGEVAVAVLAPLALTVSVITVPFAVPALTVTTTVNVVVLPAAYVAGTVVVSVQVIVPAVLTHVQAAVPAAFAAETKVVLAGSVSVTVSGRVTATPPVFVRT